MRALPEGIEVRRADPADRQRVYLLVLEGITAYQEWAPHWSPEPPAPATRARLERLYEDDDAAWVLLAEAHGDLVGVASMSTTTGADARVPNPGTVYLWQMFARREWQGTGLAGAMLDRLLDEVRRRGYTRIVLWAAAGAARARRFYEREGFELTGEEDRDSSFGLPLVQYGRAL